MKLGMIVGTRAGKSKGSMLFYEGKEKNNVCCFRKG